ncbi:adenosylmethionine decarboxylase [Flavobacteriaceae bacterium]|nr:adenosylmethionine decarboxylase [Flavobacteriaceae bacterium]
MQKISQHSPGKHILLDLWGAQKITEINFIEKALIEAVKACGSTILETKLHSFGENSGVTGVVILAESHISIHTWPEIDFCAIDVFMCGNCDAQKAIEPLRKFFKPTRTRITEHFRG